MDRTSTVSPLWQTMRSGKGSPVGISKFQGCRPFGRDVGNSLHFHKTSPCGTHQLELPSTSTALWVSQAWRQLPFDEKKVICERLGFGAFVVPSRLRGAFACVLFGEMC